MAQEQRRFTNDDVTDIVRRALAAKEQDDAVSYDDLADIADRSGISKAQLDAAIAEQERVGDFERARSEYVAKERKDFKDHLRTYLIVNGVLFLIDIFSPGGFWVHHVMIGWGIFLAIHACETLFMKREKIDKGARKLLKKRRLHRARADIHDRYGDLDESFHTEIDVLIDKHASK